MQIIDPEENPALYRLSVKAFEKLTPYFRRILLSIKWFFTFVKRSFLISITRCWIIILAISFSRILNWIFGHVATYVLPDPSVAYKTFSLFGLTRVQTQSYVPSHFSNIFDSMLSVGININLLITGLFAVILFIKLSIHTEPDIANSKTNSIWIYGAIFILTYAAFLYTLYVYFFSRNTIFVYDSFHFFLSYLKWGLQILFNSFLFPFAIYLSIEFLKSSVSRVKFDFSKASSIISKTYKYLITFTLLSFAVSLICEIPLFVFVMRQRGFSSYNPYYYNYVTYGTYFINGTVDLIFLFVPLLIVLDRMTFRKAFSTNWRMLKTFFFRTIPVYYSILVIMFVLGEIGWSPLNYIPGIRYIPWISLIFNSFLAVFFGVVILRLFLELRDEMPVDMESLKEKYARQLEMSVAKTSKHRHPIEEETEES